MSPRKNHKSFALPTSPVLLNESADDLDRVRETLNNEIKPRGMIEQLYLLDYAGLTFEVLRLRRCKMALLNTNFVPAVETVFRQLLDQSGYNPGQASATAKDIAHRWFIDKRIKKYGARMLRQFRLDVSAIEAEAFRRSAHEIELFDKLLASAESRRDKILREIAAYRNGLAQQLEKSANRIIEAEVLTHDDAVKTAVIEQADDAVKTAVVEQADDAVKTAVVEQANDAVKSAVVEQADDAVKTAVVEQADDAVKTAVIEQADDAVKTAVVEEVA